MLHFSVTLYKMIHSCENNEVIRAITFHSLEKGDFDAYNVYENYKSFEGRYIRHEAYD